MINFPITLVRDFKQVWGRIMKQTILFKKLEQELEDLKHETHIADFKKRRWDKDDKLNNF